MILRFLGLGVTLLGVIGASISFDRVVDAEFSDFHEQWVADGKPYGGRKSRREVSFLKSGFARIECMNRWLASSPRWARSHREAIRSLKFMRAWVVVSGLGFTFALVSAILGR